MNHSEALRWRRYCAAIDRGDYATVDRMHAEDDARDRRPDLGAAYLRQEQARCAAYSDGDESTVNHDPRD